MNPREHTDFSAWPPIIVVILLATTSAFLARMSLESERPPPSGQGVSTAVIQDRDARLWQDPFAVATEESGPPTCWQIDSASPPPLFRLQPCLPADGRSSGRNLAWLKELIAARRGQVHVVYALVPGGTWVGADEYRRRRRYAVLSGANLEGYIPEDPEHLGYVEEAITAGLDARADWRARLPFEWLSRGDGSGHVLLLWVDEETLGQQVASGAQPAAAFPLTRLMSLVNALAFHSAGQAQQSHTVIGPYSSTFLRAAVVDPNLEAAAQGLAAVGVQWFSPSATYPDRLLVARVGGEEKTLGDILPAFQRLIVSDDGMAEALAEEIRGRNVRSDEAVALVGLWDTAYSRRLRNLIEKHIRLVYAPGEAPAVVTASYLRGVDGRLPGNAPGNDKGSNQDAKPAERVERPEGDAQVDYLRRLALDLERRWHGKGRRIAAIGVIGDDYHDKVLALRALRASFPGAFFFTTDLDAAMLHPADNKVTRNLVVASGYGLTLRPELQGDIPPFRYGYQSAAFLATRVALGDGTRFALPQSETERNCLLRPQLFEIGYTQAVRLAGGRVEGPCDVAAPYLDPHPCAPRPPGWIEALKPPAAVLLAGLLLGIAGVAHRPHLRAWVLSLLGAAALSAGVVALLNHEPHLREPFGLLQGISFWPSQLLRLLAIVVAVGLLLKGRRLLRKGFATVEAEYPRLAAPGPGSDQPPGDRTFLAAVHRFRRCSETSAGGAPFADVPRLWRTYRRAEAEPEETGARDPRTGKDEAEGGQAGADDLPFVLACLPSWLAAILFVVLFLLTGVVLRMVLGGSPNTPTRGEIELYVNKAILFFAVVSFLLLLFHACSESFRAVWLARRLQSRDQWPDGLVRRYELKLSPTGVVTPGVRRAIDHWLDVGLIARVTEPVQRIVFYPFLVLALLILARSPLFDAWSTPGFLLALFSLFIALVVAAAWRLRTTAESLRQRAQQSLTREIADARIAGDEGLATRLEAMRDYTESLATGAFLPFSRQPLVRAALTVAGSWSGITLLEYARMVNL